MDLALSKQVDAIANLTADAWPNSLSLKRNGPYEMVLFPARIGGTPIKQSEIVFPVLTKGKGLFTGKINLALNDDSTWRSANFPYSAE